MPGFGSTGPYRAFQVFGSNVEALCGFTAVRGYAQRDFRTTPAVYYMDAASGAGAAFAVLCALHYRTRTGQGPAAGRTAAGPGAKPRRPRTTVVVARSVAG
jgi:crotonobetainyl-CoA:carnitine CoA-transferase CaiB-like acyl-CoA transferase